MSAAGGMLATLLLSGCFLVPDPSLLAPKPHTPPATAEDPPDKTHDAKTASRDEAETLRELARQVDAADDRRFTAAARSPLAAVRIEAARAFATSKRGPLPQAIVDLKSDDDPRVRAAALDAIASQKHPEALEHLTAALHDVDLPVRLAAVRSLGKLDDDKSRAVLADLLKDRAELIRAEAVVALRAQSTHLVPRDALRPSNELGEHNTHLAERDEYVRFEAIVLGAANDTSWRVRLKVAEALADYRDADATSAARRMLNDPSAEVERQVVRSLASWPLEAAVPVLLDALERDAVSVRRLAAEQLAERWPSESRFPWEAPPARRSEALADLRARYRREFSDGVRSTGFGQGSSRVPAEGSITSAGDERIEQLLAAGDFAALADLGPEVVGELERLAMERHVTLPESVYHEVLPRHSPAFAALDRLHGGDIPRRRTAAEELVALTHTRALGMLATARLCELMIRESDASVWQRALDAVGDDAREPAVRMARLALSQNAGEVRRKACEILAARPDPANEPFLLPLLDDSQQVVVLAAIRALAVTRQMADAAALKKLLASPDELVQLETAVALVRLGDPAGAEAIERLSYSRDIAVRGRLARGLGDLGDARFTAVLIRLLDDSKATVSHAALASLPRVTGCDAAQSRDGNTVSIGEQMARWKKWYEQQSRRDGAR